MHVIHVMALPSNQPAKKQKNPISVSSTPNSPSTLIIKDYSLTFNTHAPRSHHRLAQGPACGLPPLRRHLDMLSARNTTEIEIFLFHPKAKPAKTTSSFGRGLSKPDPWYGCKLKAERVWRESQQTGFRFQHGFAAFGSKSRGHRLLGS